jgi:hypothetical protein
MEIKELDQTIKVGAVFRGGSDIRPAWFIWEGRKYAIKEVNYAWMDRNGREKIHCFSVTDGTNTYEISFNAERTVWKLNKICGEA